MKVEFVDSQRKEHGVQPVLRVLEGTPAEIAPSTYYAAKTRPESARTVSDRVLAEKIERVHEDNYSVYGARKIWGRAEPTRRAGGPVHGRATHARDRASWAAAGQVTAHHPAGR
jgi:hypothetical protein